MIDLCFHLVSFDRVVAGMQSGHDLHYECSAKYCKSRNSLGWWSRGVSVHVTYNGIAVASYELENANDFQRSIQLFEDVLMLRANGASHTGLPAGVP